MKLSEERKSESSEGIRGINLVSSQGKSVAEVVRRQFLLIGTHHKDGQQKVYPLIHPKSGVLTHQLLIGVTKYHSRAKLHDVKGF